MNRIIGRHIGTKPGPFVVVFAALHGNEPAGVQALEKVLQMLEREKNTNPTFVFHGQMLALLGNRQAFASGQRFLKKDLNRLWTPANIQRIRETGRAELDAEDLEIAELLDLLHEELTASKSEVLVLLDLHTTSADGGIFCIPTDDAASLRLAKQLHAPVILGLLQGIQGTLLQFATENRFGTGGFPKHTLGVAFEGGQHHDPLSVSRLVSGTLHCLRASGCIDMAALASPHDQILKNYSADLPKVTRVRHVHHIRPGDNFQMRPGYVNFQPVFKDEVLAEDVEGSILAPDDSLILMPLYQKQGSDGFFLVDEI
ncbi:MAG: succinylglutamate desuccinylase/aspartoacylase family protein [Saprospiraceae bacterium]